MNTQPWMAVVGEVQTPLTTATLASFDFPTPLDRTVCDDDSYWLDLCVTPRVSNCRARYRDRWGPHRFERVGPIFVAAPGEPLQFRSDGGRQSSIVCKLSRQPVRELLGKDIEWSARQLSATLDVANDTIRGLLRRLALEVNQPGFAHELMIDLIASQIAIELSRYSEAADDAPATGGLAAWRLRLIDERLAEVGEAPTLGELAAICNMSVRQLTRGFRASRGHSIGEYVTRSQIETAKRLLGSSESIKAIARSMGFASASSFSYAFRRGAGVSPSQFRTRTMRPQR